MGSVDTFDALLQTLTKDKILIYGDKSTEQAYEKAGKCLQHMSARDP